MESKDKFSRRRLLRSAGAATVGIVAVAGCNEEQKGRSCGKKTPLVFNNADFYDSNGKFKVDAAKDAYFALMKYHGYPIFPNMREGLWVSDYGTGRFTELGLGAYMFLNNEQDRYMGQDLFLLPNQMLPEHYHVATAKGGPKLEGWQVRWGISYVYGEGEPTKNMKAVVPDCHQPVTVKHEVILHPGETTTLNRATARHWQFGGPEGAIVTEYATFHDNDGVRHSDPRLVFP